MINQIFTRNATGAPVIVTHDDDAFVTFIKLHVNTMEPIGSPVRVRKTQFLVRYA
jgi:hypothetical protein